MKVYDDQEVPCPKCGRKTPLVLEDGAEVTMTCGGCLAEYTVSEEDHSDREAGNGE